MRDDYSGDSWKVPVKDLQRKEQEKFLHALAGRVSARGARKLIRITHARVPIIKFEDHITGVEVDVAIDSIGAQFKSVAVGVITSIDWRVGALVRLIKLWARHHNLNDSSTGTFNSFALTMLVIFHCQTRSPAILPPLSELFGYTSGGTGREDTPEGRPMHDGKRPDLEQLRVLQEHINARAAAAAAEEQQKKGARNNKNQETLLELLSSFFCTFLGLMQGWCGPDETLSRVLRRVRVDTWHGCLTYCPWTDKKDGAYNCSIEDPFDSTDNVGRTIRDTACIERIIHSLEDAVEICTSSLSSMDHFEQGMEKLFGSEVLEQAYYYEQKLINRGELKETTAPIPPTTLWIPESLKGYVSRTQPFVQPEKNEPREGGGCGGDVGPLVGGGDQRVQPSVFGFNEVLEFPKLSFNREIPFSKSSAGTGLEGNSSLSDLGGGEEEEEEEQDEVGVLLERSGFLLGCCLHWEGLQELLGETYAALEVEAAEEAVREAEKAAQRAVRRAAKNKKNELRKSLKKSKNDEEEKKGPMEKKETMSVDPRGEQKGRPNGKEERPAAEIEGDPKGRNPEKRQRRRRQRRRNGDGGGGGDGSNGGNNTKGGDVRTQNNGVASKGKVVVVPRPPPPPPGL